MLSLSSLLEIQKESVLSAQQASKDYSIENPDDFGSCGGSWIHIKFGRKIQMKKMFIASGIIEDSATEMFGKKVYIFKAIDWQVKGYNQQNSDYKYTSLKAFVKTFEELAGVELSIHTWGD